MSAATTVNVASAAIPENKTKKVSPSLIAVYVVLVVLAVVWLLPVSYTHLDVYKRQLPHHAAQAAFRRH